MKSKSNENNLVKEIERILLDFKEPLSVFEKGQVDAFEWVKQLIEEGYGNQTRIIQSKRVSARNLAAGRTTKLRIW